MCRRGAVPRPAAHDDEDFHLFGHTPGDSLGLCHGAAGVLALAADALDRPPPTCPAAGAPGALSALLTAGGAPRDWLPCLGLR
jgi:hypothetical protein